jgi:phosphoribosylpyrophosphate synthetase
MAPRAQPGSWSSSCRNLHRALLPLARRRLLPDSTFRPVRPLRRARVLLVDDVLTTGATARACLRQVREAGAERVVLAVPVGSPDSLAAIEDEADEVIALETLRLGLRADTLKEVLLGGSSAEQQPAPAS